MVRFSVSQGKRVEGPGQSHQKQTHWEGLINVYMCITFAVDAMCSFLDIEENVPNQCEICA